MDEKKKKTIRKQLRKWSYITIRPILRVFKRLNDSGLVSEELMISVCSEIEQNSPCFISFTMRPKNNELISCKPGHGIPNSLAVVLQGPLAIKDDFTLNTVKIYINNPSIKYVIVSTWENEDKNVIEDLKSIGAIVVVSELPKNSGIGNINYQLASMKVGIQKAYELGADYICKTRTDQRICDEYGFDMMYNLVNTFPVQNGAGLFKRFVVLSTEHENMMFPYYISDFLYFGYKDDMIKLLSIPEECRQERPKFVSYRKRLQDLGNAEVYIMRNLIRILDLDYGISVKEYWEFAQKALIIVGKNDIGLYWNKYDTKYCEHKRNGTYFTTRNRDYMTSNFGLSSWLSLYYSQLVYDSEYEEELDKNYGYELKTHITTS